MKKIIAGNWKFNKELRNLEKAVNFLELLEEKIKKFNNVEVKIFSHDSLLSHLARKAKKIKIGAQDMHWEDDGSFTGAHFSQKDLMSLGVKETLVGHSETKLYFGVTDDKVALKLKAVFKNGILPTICVGEDIEEKERGDTKEVLERQIVQGILPALKAVNPKPSFSSLTERSEVKDENAFFIAYEPVYAIAGFAKLRGMAPKPPKAEDIKYALEAIRKIFSEQGYSEIKILYGGSSNPENARELLALPFVDGLLPGTASWEIDSFFEMIKIADGLAS